MTKESTNVAKTEDDELHPDFKYGCGSWRPDCLQCLNKISVVVALGSLAVCFQFMVVTGMFSVVLTTIEKRFGLPSTESAWISVGYDLGSLVLLLALSYIGSRYGQWILLFQSLIESTQYRPKADFQFSYCYLIFSFFILKVISHLGVTFPRLKPKPINPSHLVYTKILTA